MLDLQHNRSPSEEHLDVIFHALSHKVRRAQIALLAKGPCMVKELADPFEMSLPAASKHLKVLENAGLVTRTIQGRSHRCVLNGEQLRQVQEWLSRYRAYWSESLGSLATYAERETTRSNKEERGA